MTTTTTTAPRQLRFPGQAAAHEGPVDMSMMYLMHHAFRRDLAAFAKAVPVTPLDDRAAWRAMAERWQRFSTFLHHHHHGEDTWLWPFLVQRATGDERSVLEAMEDEHADLDPGLQACTAGFARLADQPDADARAALSVRLTAVRESLGRHLAHEETATIALIQSVMSQEDWEEVDQHVKEGRTFGTLVKAVPWALHQVPAELREQMFTHTGTAHRLMWVLTRRRFERSDRRAFRHLR